MWMFPLVQLIGLLFKGVLEQMTVHSLSILIFKESSNWQAKQAWARSSGHRKTLSEPENGIFSRFRLQSIVLCMDTIFIFKWPVSNFLSRINKDQFQVQKMKQLSETFSKYGLTSKYYYITILKSYWYIQVSVKGLNSGVISKVSPAPKRVWRPTNFISEFIFQQHKQQKSHCRVYFRAAISINCNKMETDDSGWSHLLRINFLLLAVHAVIVLRWFSVPYHMSMSCCRQFSRLFIAYFLQERFQS